MATFDTPIGKVRYSGNFRYITAVPNERVAIGTTVVKRSNSLSPVEQAFWAHYPAVLVDTATGETLKSKVETPEAHAARMARVNETLFRFEGGS